MAHGITDTDHAVYAQKSAWHGLGTVVETAPSIPGALQLAGLDWRVEAWPLSATDGDVRQTVPSHVLNVRSDTREPLGVVGSSYTPLQNDELADFAGELMGQGARVESAGSLRGGRRVWFLIRTGDEIGLGTAGEDRVVPYVLLANGHDGGLAFTVQPTSVRVVCSNTLHMATRGSKDAAKAGRALRLRHTSGIRFRVEDARRVLDAHGIIVRTFREQAEALAGAPMLSRSEVTAYHESVYAAAFSEPSSDRGRARRDNVLSAWRVGMQSRRQTLAGLGGTPWAALNSVTEWADHRAGSKLTRDERQYRAWFGSGADLKAAAWDKALALV